MREGDLVWFNGGGSQATALVLTVVRTTAKHYTYGEGRDGVYFPHLPCLPGTKMALLHWNGNITDPRPPIYDDKGARYNNPHRDRIRIGWSRIHSKTGMAMFRVME